MSRLLFAAVLAIAVVACSSTTLEQECIDLCDRGERCVDERDDTRFEACAQGCRDVAAEGQQNVAEGTITQACLDANTDVLACFNRLNCLELLMSLTSTPARCKGEFEDREEVCQPM